MKKSSKCPKCDDTDIIRAFVNDHGHANSTCKLELATHAQPDAFFFKGERTTELEAYVCAACGFTELCAAIPLALVSGPQ